MAAMLNATTVFINAPFTNGLGGGVGDRGHRHLRARRQTLGAPRIYDYWDPSTVVQRIVNGAAMDAMKSHGERRLSGVRVLGAVAGSAGQRELHSGKGGLTAFPAEPTATGFDYTIVPGHLGQVWMGASPSQFFTLTVGGTEAGEQH